MCHSGNAVLATILTKFKRAVRTVELMRRVRGPEETEERRLGQKGGRKDIWQGRVENHPQILYVQLAKLLEEELV